MADTAGPVKSTNNPSQADITLYWLEKSRSQRILWLLEELNVPYKLKLYHRGESMMADPALKQIHPLGKSPVIGVKPLGAEKETIIAESGVIVEYLVDYFGEWMKPKRYRDGMEGQIGGETEEWMRYRHIMHYTEGSLMPVMVVALIVQNIKKAPVPFFIRPISNGIANKLSQNFVEPNCRTHFGFLEQQIETSDGDFLCGKKLTGADILMSFPLIAAKGRVGLSSDKNPKLVAYTDRLQEREAYKRAIRKIEEIDNSFHPNL